MCIIFFFFSIVALATHANQQLAKTEDSSLVKEIYKFRGYDLSEKPIEQYGLVSDTMQLFSASYRSSLELFSYCKRHVENFRSLTKFYHAHQVHIVGRTQLNELVEIKLGISEKEYEDVGTESDLHKTHPTIEIKFKTTAINELYSSNDFERALLNLRKACLNINKCHGVYIRAAQGITPYYYDITRYNPGSLSMPSDQQFHQILLTVEWHDGDGHVLDAISYAHGLGSLNDFIWLENLYKNHEIREKKGGIFSLFSPEVLDNSATMIRHAVAQIEKAPLHRPCARLKKQGFMSLYHSQCLRFEKKLQPLKDVQNTLEKINSAISVAVAENAFLVFDYYGRWFNYPAILLIIR